MTAHLGYIVAAFAVTGVVIAAMIVLTLADYRDLSARLEKLHRRPPR